MGKYKVMHISCFLLKSFIVLSLKFRSLIHFELILYMVWGRGSTPLFCMWMSICYREQMDGLKFIPHNKPFIISKAPSWVLWAIVANYLPWRGTVGAPDWQPVGTGGLELETGVWRGGESGRSMHQPWVLASEHSWILGHPVAVHKELENCLM